MRWKGLMWACVIIVLLIAGLGVWIYNKASPGVTPVFLQQVTGIVEVNDSGVLKLGSEGLEISTDATVSTKKGTVTIILEESVLISMKEDSEISIKEVSKNIRVSQSKGLVWNKFTGLVGVQSYDVSLPHTTATVRGTGFFTDSSDQIIVGEGTVLFSSRLEKESIKESVFANKKAQYTNGKIEIIDVSPSDKETIVKEMKEDLMRLIELRMHIIRKYQWLVDQMKEKYGKTDAELLQYLDMIDQGVINDVELIEKSPVKIEAFSQIKALNDKIKEQSREIKLLD